jgi:hypothetical protein
MSCRALRTAAAAATEELQLSNITQQRADSIARWLDRHSSKKLRCLSLTASRLQPARAVSALPHHKLSYLKQLALSSFDLLQHPGSCSSGCSEPVMTEPGGLCSCCSSLSQLTKLSCLQRLQLDDVTHLLQPPLRASGVPSKDDAKRRAAESAESAALDAALGAVFSKLPQLTELQLALPSTSSLAAVSLLTQLQKLDLTTPISRKPFQLQLLPSSLTQLQLSSVVSSSKSLSDGWQLPSLKVLTAYESILPPAALLRMPHLQQLRLDAHGLYGSMGVLNLKDVLNALSQLQHMVYVVLRDFKEVAPAASYAALTASPYLKGFELIDCQVAAAAAQHMCTPGRLRPQLQRMRIAAQALWATQHRWSVYEASGYLGLVLGPQDAAQLASCCPQLQELGPVMVRRGTAAEDLQPLVQLSVLTRLQIGGAACDDTIAEQVLAHLTGEPI